MALLKEDELIYSNSTVCYYAGRCTLYFSRDHYKLMSLYVPGNIRKKKIGTTIVQWCCDYVKAENKPLWLFAGPYGFEEGPNRDQLVRWYMSFGFVPEWDDVPWRSLWYNKEK